MKFRKVILAAAFVVPLSEKGEWQQLKFNKLTPNEISYSKEGLKVVVKESASPLIYPFKQPLSVSQVAANIVVSKPLSFSEGKTQGEKGVDDFSFRVGLVIKGEKTLNFLQKSIAPKWITTLYDLAPKGMGVDHIFFLIGHQEPKIHNKKRDNPLSDLIKEDNVWQLDYANKSAPFSFQLNHKFEKPKEVLALWLSIDGDDTKSSYEVLIKELKLNGDSDKIVESASKDVSSQIEVK